MVGIFSRFYVGKVGHRRTQSAIEEKAVLPLNTEASSSVITSNHGIEIAVEFKPVEHPTEPHDNDRPILCPLPEPSILNDGRIWKERVSQAAQRRADLPIMRQGVSLESDFSGAKPRPSGVNRSILPSVSAPEHNILHLLEEYNAARM